MDQPLNPTIIGATGVAASGSHKRKQVNSIPNSLPVQKIVKKNVNNSKVTTNPVADTSNITHRHLKPISTDNTYNILQDNENEVIVQRNTNDQKKPRIPPVVVQMDKNLVINMLRGKWYHELSHYISFNWSLHSLLFG